MHVNVFSLYLRLTLRQLVVLDNTYFVSDCGLYLLKIMSECNWVRLGLHLRFNFHHLLFHLRHCVLKVCSPLLNHVHPKARNFNLISYPWPCKRLDSLS